MKPGVPVDHDLALRLAKRHWWWRGRRKILGRLITDLAPPIPRAARILEVGCGAGTNAEALWNHAGSLYGLDMSNWPLNLARNSFTSGVVGHASTLPFGDGTFDMIVALDVIEHLEDDLEAMHEFRRVLKPGGVAVVFVPALELLWGPMDDIGGHFRRYTKTSLRNLLLNTGFTPARLTYFNTIFFPPILLARLAMRAGRVKLKRAEVEMGSGLNEVLRAIFSFEASLLGLMDFPVGVSLAALARRQDLS